ncbi:MAG TPA: NAD(P)/FAD-dependent oxidoreductase, partial [Actinomycetales bacterium]
MSEAAASGTFDVVVIGLGPGGEDVANRLASAGLRVLAVDHGLVGGECPYWGCIPTKMMVRGAGALAEARRVGGLSGSVGDVVPDWTPVARRIRDEATAGWDDTIAVDRLTGHGATVLRGHGRVVGPRKVEVDGVRHVAARGVVVATGSTPVVPAVPGLADVPFWTNHELVESPRLPASLAVLGGGAIGCELAQVMARFGVEVTVVEGADRLLALEEPAAGELVAAALRADGVDVRTGTRAASVASAPGGGITVTTTDGGSVTAEALLVATGRRVDVASVGLDSVGVDPAARSVPVDEWCRVTEGVWAIGDVTGRGAFTHVSMYQADVVVRDVLGQGGPPAAYHAVPRVTFTDPEVGAVGLGSAQAREQLASVRVGTAAVSSSTRGWIHGPG